MEIKGKLEQDIFGQSIDTYYKLKLSAYEGNPQSKLKLEKMRDTFIQALKKGDLINYN
jgi:restriction endonuclease S subunit